MIPAARELAGRLLVSAAVGTIALALLGPNAAADAPRGLGRPGPPPTFPSSTGTDELHQTGAEASSATTVTVTVDPAAELRDGQVVAVSAAGLGGDEQVLVAQCLTGTSAPEHDCGNVFSTFVDADGNLAIDYRVEAVIHPFSSDPIDCRVQACELWVAAAGDIVRRGTAALEFDPDGPLRPEMALTVTPREHLVDGQVVDVGISGFTPDGPVDVVECSLSSDLSGSGCAADAVQSLTTDSFGALDTTYAVALRFDSADGPVDCRREDCILVAVDRSVPIDFGRGYLFELLDFTDAVAPPDPPDPAPPTLIAPRFTG